MVSNDGLCYKLRSYGVKDSKLFRICFESARWVSGVNRCIDTLTKAIKTSCLFASGCPVWLDRIKLLRVMRGTAQEVVISLHSYVMVLFRCCFSLIPIYLVTRNWRIKELTLYKGSLSIYIYIFFIKVLCQYILFIK